MATIMTVVVVLLFGFALWLFLGGPTPNLLPKKTRAMIMLQAWMMLRTKITDEQVRAKLDELLPLLLKDADSNAS